MQLPLGASFALLAAFHNRVAYIRPTDVLPKGAVNKGLAWDHLQRHYTSMARGVVYMDDFLRPQAVKELLAFAEESTVWHETKRGYLGSYQSDGVATTLLLQVLWAGKVRVTVGHGLVQGYLGCPQDIGEGGATKLTV